MDFTARDLETAAARVSAVLDRRPPWWCVHKKRTLATIRTSYRRRPLPTGFVLLEVQAGRARRRLAAKNGIGVPILLLPGLYADLHEAFFIETADLLSRRLSRPVLLAEDRFAAATIELNAKDLPSIRDLGEEAAALAYLASQLTKGPRASVRHSSPSQPTDLESPEVVAFSAGAVSALAAPEHTFRRAVLWSAAVQPVSVLSEVRRHFLLNAYFSSLHARAFRQDGAVATISRERMVGRLLSDRPPFPSELDVLAIHAVDDPVAPARETEALQSSRFHACLVASGGHLGFSAIAGRDVYLLPHMK